jgi:hypothetical protein
MTGLSPPTVIYGSGFSDASRKFPGYLPPVSGKPISSSVSLMLTEGWDVSVSINSDPDMRIYAMNRHLKDTGTIVMGDFRTSAPINVCAGNEMHPLKTAICQKLPNNL